MFITYLILCTILFFILLYIVYDDNEELLVVDLLMVTIFAYVPIVNLWIVWELLPDFGEMIYNRIDKILNKKVF